MDANRQDDEHLKMLSIFHWVLGGLGVVFSLFPLLYVAMGVFFLSAAPQQNGPNGPPPETLGWIFVGVGLVTVLIGQTISWLTVYSGFLLRDHRNRTMSMVVAAILCLMIPFGTVLGVFTIVVLQRDTVRELYETSDWTSDAFA